MRKREDGEVVKERRTLSLFLKPHEVSDFPFGGMLLDRLGARFAGSANRKA